MTRFEHTVWCLVDLLEGSRIRALWPLGRRLESWAADRWGEEA